MKTVRHSTARPGEDTAEWTANDNVDDGGDGATAEKMLVKSEQETSPPPTAGSDEPAPVVDQRHKLRLNPNLATDPARWSPANGEPQPLPPPTTVITAAVASSSSAVDGQNHNAVTVTAPRAIQIFICNPCGIRFSSMSTLDAHQTYYCARRNKKDSESEDAKVPVVVETDEIVMGNDADSRPSSVEPSVKSARTGKQYKCPHCSYSADKKVSLNRHMRMHSISPVSVQSPPCPPDTVVDPSVVDRYCQNCDIRFSNLRTYQAHKTHYCNTRHVVKPTPSSSPMPQNSSPTNVPTYLALPTNPVILVPYTLVQNASVLSALSTDAGPPPPTDTACIVLSDGTLQPIAQALIPTKFNDSVQRENSQSPPEVAFSPPKKVEVVDQDVKRPIVQPSSPLDLRLKRVEKSSHDGEEEKENRRSDGNITDAESIVCAPSIPYMILSPSSSPTTSPPPSMPPGAKLSQQHRSMQHQHHPINGVIQKPQTPVVEIFDNPERNGKFSVSSLLQASNRLDNVKHEQIAVNNTDGHRHHNHRHHQLPAVVQRFNPMMHNNNNNNNINNKSRNIAVAASLQPPSVVQRNDLLNSTVLPYFTPEMTLRLAATNQATTAAEQRSGIPPVAHQFFLKHGPSKCESCNIVFCKYENFLAHKKHYCASRPPPPTVDVAGTEDADKTSPEGSPGPLAKQPLTVTSPRSSKDSVSPTPVPTPVATLKPPMIQFICHTCGVKFSSFDNLTTHQSFYCPYRQQAEPAADKSSSSSSSSSSPHHGAAAIKCPKCKMIVDGNLLHHQCTAVANCWKCPVCGAICQSASAAQKHLDNHNGIRAFVCTICQYKGNTLRGLRTHIRMHFNKRLIPDLMEEDYVTCVIDENSATSMTDGAGGKTPIFDTEKPQQVNVKFAAAGTAETALQAAADKNETAELLTNIKQEHQPNGTTGSSSSDAAEVSAGFSYRRGGGEPPTATADQAAVGAGAAIKRPMTTKYCKACDISFNYLTTFIAHKKYYCRNSAEYRCNAENATKNGAATSV